MLFVATGEVTMSQREPARLSQLLPDEVDPEEQPADHAAREEEHAEPQCVGGLHSSTVAVRRAESVPPRAVKP